MLWNRRRILLDSAPTIGAGLVCVHVKLGESRERHVIYSVISRCLDGFARSVLCRHLESQILHLSRAFDFHADRPLLALGLEGSANKFGAGIIKHSEDGIASVLSNIRHTYITPPGEGFQPRDTALHHREWALKVIDDCLVKAGVSMHDLDCICFTQGTCN